MSDEVLEKEEEVEDNFNGEPVNTGSDLNRSDLDRVLKTLNHNKAVGVD